MSDRPVFIQSGEVPRLIPVVSDTSKEKRVLSVFLASLMAVEEFRNAMLASLDVRTGVRSSFVAFTEIVFKGKDVGKDRPDGILVLNSGKKIWTALVEAKIGNAELDAEQVSKYVGYAKDFGVDAVITISNQFVALPDHHPVQLPKVLTRQVQLFHWSWMFIVTQASLLLTSSEIKSADQRYILNEALRYWRHDSAGISTFDRMNREWRELVDKVRNRAALNRSSPEVENTVASWHQEERDLCLLLSRRLGRNVDLLMPRVHRNDPLKRLRDDCDELVKTQMLRCELAIPGAAAPLCVHADLVARTIRCSMRLQAPGDKKRSTARVNWLTKQLTKTDPSGIYVKAFRRGRAEETEKPLVQLYEDPSALDSLNTDVEPLAFEVFTIDELAARFAGNKTFIEALEETVPAFYNRVGQHLRAWMPAPPLLSERDPAKEPPAESIDTQVLISRSPDDAGAAEDLPADIAGTELSHSNETDKARSDEGGSAN
jgi:hypothetical protein